MPAKKQDYDESTYLDLSRSAAAANSGANSSVDALLAATERREKEAHLSHAERTRLARLRRREKDRQRGRLHIDLPVEIKDRLMALAKREGVPVSQLIVFMVIGPLTEMEAASNPLWGYLKPSRCAKFDSVIDLEKRLKEKK